MNINGDFSTTETTFKKKNDETKLNSNNDSLSIFDENKEDFDILNGDNIEFDPNNKYYQKYLEDKKISDAEKLKNSTHINGELDEQVRQGSKGDCWLLSSVLALNATDKGKEIIKNAITLNDDGSATVNFEGVGKSYTITREEILNNDIEYKSTTTGYSKGDNDMLVLELATEKLVKDISDKKVPYDAKGLYYNTTGKELDEGGYEPQMLYYLTGKKADILTSILPTVSSLKVNEALENISNHEDVAVTFSLTGRKRATLTDGKQFTYHGGGHALAVTGIDKDNKTLTFVNPWNSDKEYEISWKEFSKMGVQDLSILDLNKKA